MPLEESISSLFRSTRKRSTVNLRPPPPQTFKIDFQDPKRAKMRDLDNLFGEYVHLKHLPREAEALHILRKVASCVKPIMRRRGWKVGVLCEFLPEQSNLLGT
jgi:hypothetical protein